MTTQTRDEELAQARAEAEKYHRYYNDAMKVRLDVEEVLDEALGTEEEDGAGYGLAGDVALLAQHEKAARAEADKLRSDIEVMQARIDSARRWLDDPQDLTPVGQLHQIRAVLLTS